MTASAPDVPSPVGHRSAAGVAAMALALLLAGSASAQTSPVETAPVILYDAERLVLDPAVANDPFSTTIVSATCDRLYEWHYRKRPLTWEPVLAEGPPEISEDGTVYRFRLRKGVRYAPNACFGTGPDGRPATREVRAEDFERAIRRIADPHVKSPVWWLVRGRIEGLDDWRKSCRAFGTGDFRRYALPIRGLRATDDRTLRIELTAPLPQLPSILAMTPFAPTPPEAMDYYLASAPGPDGKRVETPAWERSAHFRGAPALVGTGPYRLTDLTEAGRLTLRANPVHDWETGPEPDDANTPATGLARDGRKLPLTPTLVLQRRPDASTWLPALAEGKAQMAWMKAELLADALDEDGELAARWADRGVRLATYRPAAVYWLNINCRDPALGASPSLRRALSLATNAAAFAKALFQSPTAKAQNVLPSTIAGHRQAGASPYAAFDPNAARAELDKAREELKQAGRLVAGQLPDLTLLLSRSGDLERKSAAAELLKEQLGEVGITLRILAVSESVHAQSMRQGTSQLTLGGWGADHADPINCLQNFYGPNRSRGLNASFYANPGFDELYRKALKEADFSRRAELCGKMARIVSEDCPVVLICEPIAAVAHAASAGSVLPPPIGQDLLKHLRLPSRSAGPARPAAAEKDR